MGALLLPADCTGNPQVEVRPVEEAGGSVEGVAFGEGVFVAVTPFRLLVSRDGENWQPIRAPARMNEAESTEVGFLAVGNAGIPMPSRDGVHWETLRLNPDWDLSGVAYGNGVCVLVVGLGEAWVSRDPKRFHRLEVAAQPSLDILGGDFGNNRFTLGGRVFRVLILRPK
ncbi:hypothetical protein [Thermus sp.]|uniref:hypothetical protein n=1 Tax=Thermus sp. TaxID=275 RepID=UPI0025D39B3D|nr:hypothetical protein [Thermus sp.]MCS6868076.1 hypothetical protein [Thermus sp.]MDW8358794.1 hypothetical protein [Thermus sp.]